jgi:hypothetical protein
LKRLELKIFELRGRLFLFAWERVVYLVTRPLICVRPIAEGA